MNKLAQIMHDPAGRLGLVLGLVGGCTTIVLSKVSKAIFFPHPSRSQPRNTGCRTVRLVSYPRRATGYIALASGC